jgi:S1-C subfamily serine protease
MRYFLILLHLFVMGCGFAEELTKPPVPDPFGLGERLALIDHLREQMGVQPPADATLEQLTAIYWKHTKVPTAANLSEDPALAQDRMRRMRAELQERYKITAPAEAGEAALGKLLSDARAATNEAALKVLMEKAAARDNPASQADVERFAEQDRNAAKVRRDSIESDIRSDQRELEIIDTKRRNLEAQAKGMVENLKNLRNRYEETVAAHNHQVNLYNTKTQEGSTDALLTLEKVHDLREDGEAQKVIIDEQLAAYEKLVAEDKQLDAERARIQERIARGAERSAEEDVKIGSSGKTTGPTTPGGVADAPATGSQQAKIVAGVVLIMVPGVGSGTGFIVSRDGYIVTNAHVLGSAKAKPLALWDASAARKPVTLRVIDYAEADDLALLKAEFGSPYQPFVMQEIYELSRPLLAAGFPLAGHVADALQTSPSDIVLSRGILGSVRRNNNRVEWLQHDCRIASGNSGGPIIDQQTGSVIGVNTMVLTTKEFKAAGDDINLAIPIRKVIDRFAQHLKP